jgi:hypothetical protein
MKEFIKDVHYYMDGDRVVFTEEYHLQRGKCCNNKCKHCPYKSLKTTNMDQTPELTFGQQLVGLTFNPSADPKVQRAKELCAELADLLNEHYNEDRRSSSYLKIKLFEHTLGEILNAQMNVVKVLTLKY